MPNGSVIAYKADTLAEPCKVFFRDFRIRFNSWERKRGLSKFCQSLFVCLFVYCSQSPCIWISNFELNHSFIGAKN